MQEFHRSRVNRVIQNNEWRIKLRRERKSIQIERKKDLIQSAKEKGVLSRCRITFHRVSKVSPSFIPSLRRVWVRTVTILLHFFFPSTRPARIQIKDPLPPLDTTLPSFISFLLDFATIGRNERIVSSISSERTLDFSPWTEGLRFNQPFHHPLDRINFLMDN